MYTKKVESCKDSIFSYIFIVAFLQKSVKMIVECLFCLCVMHSCLV